MNVKNLTTTIILFLAFVSVKASPSDSLSKANDYYASNEFAKAIVLYENIIAEGYESSTLYFNLGNAFYKNGEITKAILYYERAKLLTPNDKDIQFNLEMLNQFVVDKIEVLPRPFFVKWAKSIVNLSTIDGWAKISLISFVFALIFGLTFFLSINSFIKKTSFSVGVLLLIITIISYGYAHKQLTKIENRNQAIVFSPTVTVKASPLDNGINLFVIHEGLKVKIVREQSNWIEIELEDGNKGWVKKAVLEII